MKLGLWHAQGLMQGQKYKARCCESHALKLEITENWRKINGKSMTIDENPEGRPAGRVISPREQPKIIENQAGKSMENQ